MDVFAVSLYDLGVPFNAAAVVFLMGYWCLSGIIHWALNAKSEKYRDMGIRRQRNVVTYFLEIIATTTSFFVLTIGFPRLITVSGVEEPHDEHDILVASVGIAMVFYLYIFELVYRIEVNWPLMMHHLLTLIITAMTCFMLWDTMQPAAAYPMILVYSAITEQSVFVALLLHRFGYRCRGWFHLSVLSGIVIKVAVFGLGFVVLKKAILDVDLVSRRNDFPWKSFMAIAFPTINVLLLVVQVYSIRVYWLIANKSTREKVENKLRGIVVSSDTKMIATSPAVHLYDTNASTSSDDIIPKCA